MGANFWHSTHYLYWIKASSAIDLQRKNPLDRSALTEDEIDSVHLASISCKTKYRLALPLLLIHDHYIVMEEMGILLRCRQIITYSAIIFYRRFYLTQSFCNYDPHLLAGTALFLSSKVEEGQISLRNIVFILNQCITGTADDDEATYKFQESDVLECEFYLVQALNYDMVLHHPFQPLIEFLDEAKLEDECLRYAWQLLQYSYRTDIILLHPPFMVAYAAACVALSEAGYDACQVLLQTNIKLQRITDVVDEFRDSLSDVSRLTAIQSTAMEKLSRIIPIQTRPHKA